MNNVNFPQVPLEVRIQRLEEVIVSLIRDNRKLVIMVNNLVENTSEITDLYVELHNSNIVTRNMNQETTEAQLTFNEQVNQTFIAQGALIHELRVNITT